VSTLLDFDDDCWRLLTTGVADRGQGLNNSILDAASLGRQIELLEEKSIDSLAEAVAAYEKEVWERGKEAVEMSNVNSLSIHNWEQLQSSPLFKAGLNKNVEKTE
jgi:2-polyprenyl-6-methoxyphenol hydroxylase-like FAD-dependent oxidoreductase